MQADPAIVKDGKITSLHSPMFPRVRAESVDFRSLEDEIVFPLL